MDRNITTYAIVLRRERIGEFHKSLSLLTSDMGLVTATAYGAYKMHSSLRLGSEPFTWSRLRLYHNPVKRSHKVMELEILASFEGLQKDLSRLAAASLWAEVAQKSYGAGDVSGGLYSLFLQSLQALDAAEPRREPYVTAQFLWRFLGLAGYQPDASRCDRCGAALGEGRPGTYSQASHSLLCVACGLPTDPPIPPGALRYLEATNGLSLPAALGVSLDPAALGSLSRLLTGMVQSVLEGRLASLRWVGAGR
jgi:DNA repair protein RecO (recombination protein O)